jgi:hypothetical protein
MQRNGVRKPGWLDYNFPIMRLTPQHIETIKGTAAQPDLLGVRI